MNHGYNLTTEAVADSLGTVAKKKVVVGGGCCGAGSGDQPYLASECMKRSGQFASGRFIFPLPKLAFACLHSSALPGN